MYQATFWSQSRRPEILSYVVAHSLAETLQEGALTSASCIRQAVGKLSDVTPGGLLCLFPETDADVATILCNDSDVTHFNKLAECILESLDRRPCLSNAAESLRELSSGDVDNAAFPLFEVPEGPGGWLANLVNRGVWTNDFVSVELLVEIQRMQGRWFVFSALQSFTGKNANRRTHLSSMTSQIYSNIPVPGARNLKPNGRILGVTAGILMSLPAPIFEEVVAIKKATLAASVMETSATSPPSNCPKSCLMKGKKLYSSQDANPGT